MADIRIRGAKAGQKQPRKPNISKDTAASISTAKLLYGLGEGEIYGLADGAKSIRLDGTPLVDDAGNPNFEGVTWDFRNGSNDQEYIKGFPDVSNETPVNVELRSSQPWIKAFNDTQISAVRVRLKWNRLSQTNGENGDVKGYKIDYAIDLQTDGGAYQTVLTTKIQDKTSAGYERTHRIDLPQAKTGWQLRVRRITPNSTSDLIQDTMMIDAVAEVIDVKLSYPNTALLGVQYNAELFNNIAKMSVRVKGKIIRVPDNYDPVARTYTGIWTGNFKDAYSNNPAWVFYDLCTQWRGGLGERLDATMIDRWSLYALGQYCDQQVSDGQGGLEPRFTCNVYLQKQEEAYTVLQNIAGIFRAMSFWTGERIMLDADVPQDSIYTYSSANIVGGVAGIQYSGTRNRDRHTLAKVAWDNPNNDYQTEYEYIRDEKAMSKFGVKVLDLSAFGCTSQAQAQRAGLWALKTEQLETRQVTFSVGLDGTIPRVGNIISLSDEAFAGRANGGRVSTVNGTQRIIELDREVTASVGDVLIINGGSGKSERRNISNVVGNRITVTAGFTSAEPEHVWAIETADLKLMRFRVMSITENDDATYAITAIQHEPQKYDAIDFGTDVKPTDITIVNPDTVDAPDTVSIESRHREVQGQTVTTLVISWAQVSGAVAYDVEWRKDDGTWIKLPRTGNVSAEIEGVYSGNYLARVRSVSAFEVQSQATTSILTEVKGKVGLPPAVVGLTATGVLFGMDLKWGFQAGSGDAAFTEIQVGSAPNVNVATLTQVSYPTNTHTVTGLQGNLKQSYRARLVDKLGFKSPWSAWVTGTTDASADKVMDLIQGQINESSLNQALTSKIEKIETNSSSISGINTEVDKAKADIIEANKVIAANKLEASNAVAAANTEITKAKADIAAADKVIAANKTEAANAVAAANKAIADNKLIASNAVAAANKEIAASKVIIDSNKAEIAASRTELNTAKTQLATAITDINTANTKIADSKLLIDANKAKLVLTDAEVAEAKTKVTALETDYNDNKTSVSNALIALTDEDKSLASDLSTLTASYEASETKLVQDLKVLADKDVALTNSVTTLSSSYEANKTKVATDITTLVNKDTALNSLITTLDSEYRTNKASVSSSLITLTDKDTALTSDISKLNTKTDNTNAEIATVKGLVSDNTSSIATTKTDITAAYKQAIEDIEIGGRNYFVQSYLSIRSNWINSTYLTQKDPLLLEPNTTYTFYIGQADITSGDTVLSFYGNNRPIYGQSVEGAVRLHNSYIYHSGVNGRQVKGFRRTFTTDDTGITWLYCYNPMGLTNSLKEVQIFKGTVLQDWSPAPEDIEADYNAKISTEATARADADKTITSSVTALESDYDANKASVTNSLSTLTDKDTSLTNQLTDLTSTVGTNTANITDNHSTLVAEDKAIADSVTALDTKYEDNKTSVSNQLSALVNKDTAIANQLIALDTDYKDNKTAVSNSLSALSDEDTALGSSITDLTAIVDTNTASITAEATARADADKTITSSVTALESDYDANKASVTQSLSTLTSKDTALTNSIDALTTRVGTAEGTIISNNTALVNKDKALTDSLSALTTDYDDNKTTVSNSLSALSTADTALGNRITTLDTDYKGNKTAIRNELTAVSNKVDSTASSLSTLTTTVGGNTTKISQESTARSNADTALGKRITDTDAIAKNAQSRVGTAETAISNNTGAIATTNTNLTAAYKQAIADIEIGGRNYIVATKAGRFVGSATILGKSNAYSIDGNVIDITSHPRDLVGFVVSLQGNEGKMKLSLTSDATSIATYYTFQGSPRRNTTLKKTGNLFELDLEVPEGSTKLDIGVSQFPYSVPHQLINLKLEKGNKITDWSPAPEDVEADYNAKISTEATTRSDADTALGSRITTLDTDYKDNKTTVSNSLTALSNADTALGSRITTLDTDYKGNKTAIRNELTAVSNKTNSTATSLGNLTTTVGNNTTKISQESTARSNADTALGKRITDTDAIAKNAQSRVGTAETAISNANSAIAQQKTDITAAYKQAIDDIEIGGRNLIVLSASGVVEGRYLNSSGGTVTSANWFVTDNIPVTSGTSYILSGYRNLGSAPSTVFYDASGTYISGIAGAKRQIVTAPVNAASMKISLEKADKATIKLEKGNKATDWTPAPEDVEADYNAKISTESTARSTADTALGNRITTLDTDYQGNKTAIRNELTAVSNKTNSTATSLGTLTTTVGNNTAKISQESTARSNADTALGNRITATDAIAKNAQSRVGTAETAISNATNAIATLRTDVTAEFDNLEIGGQNLLPNSDFSKGYTAWSNASDIAQVNVQGIGLYTTVTNTSETGAFGVYATDEYRTAKIYKDETYTLSWLGQGTFDNLNYIHLLSAKERNFRLPIVPLKNGRTNKYEITFEAPYTTDDLNILMGALDKPKDAWFQFSGLMLQKGNKATEWTPSPEDNKAAIQSEAIARADADTAIGKLVTAVTARTATAEGKITTLTQTTADNNTAIAQSKQVLEARFDNLLVGGENLVVDSMEEGFYRTYGNSTHIFSDKSDGYETRILRSNCSVANNNFGFTTRDHNISVIEGQEYTLSFHGQATFNNLNYIYLMRDDGSNFQLPPIVMGSGLRNRKTLTFTAPWSTEKGYLLLAARNYSAGSWFAIGGLMLQKGNSATEFVPNVSGTRALLAQESKATADKFGKMELEWTVKTDIGGRISGFGLMSSATQTDFAVNADKFYIAPPTGSSKGTSPFMVLTSSKTINGTSVPAGTYIESAFIHNGSIDTAKIKNLSVSTAKIANLAVDTAQIANGAIETAKIGNLAVDTLQINDYAVTVPRAFYSPSFPGSGTEGAVFTFTAEAKDIILNVGFEHWSGEANNILRVYVDGSMIRNWSVPPNSYYFSQPLVISNALGKEIKLTRSSLYSIIGATMTVIGAKK